MEFTFIVFLQGIWIPAHIQKMLLGRVPGCIHDGKKGGGGLSVPKVGTCSEILILWVRCTDRRQCQRVVETEGTGFLSSYELYCRKTISEWSP